MHNSPAVTSAKSLGLTSTAFLIVAFLTDIASTLQTPTLSIFLIDEAHARPAVMEFFFIGSAVIRILVSQFLVGRSDKRGDRKSLIVFCCLLGVLACTLFVWNRNYFVLLFVGVFLGSFGSAANPQMSTLAYEHTDKTRREAAIFSSFLRTQVLLTWVTGPPLAYALAMGFGFMVIYLSATVAFIVCGVIVRLFLPPMQKELPLTTDTVEVPRHNRRGTLLLLVVCTLMWGSNSLYIIDMSLFIIDELHLPGKLAGAMMGAAAGLEIPTMLIAGYFARRLGKRFLMCAAVVDGVCFYVGMLMAHSSVILLDLQLLNTIFTDILGGIGMLYFQDLVPGQAGPTITLHTNTPRMDRIIAGSVTGIVAEIQNYYAVFWSATVMIITTLFCLLRIKDAQGATSTSRPTSQVIVC